MDYLSQIGAEFRDFVTWYEANILAIITSGYIGDKLYHMLAGLILWVAVALLFRRPLNSRLPLGTIVVAELFNELVDYAHEGLRVADTLLDMASTWFFPFVVSAMFTRMMTRGEASADPAPALNDDPVHADGIERADGSFPGLVPDIPQVPERVSAA